jgi:hypothetical protein
VGLFDFRGRPVAAEVPAPDEVRLRSLVAERCADWRSEPGGIPRAPSSGCLFFFRGRLGHPLSSAEYAVVERLWRAERARGVGGGHGYTTHDREPDRLDFVERVMRRYGK